MPSDISSQTWHRVVVVGLGMVGLRLCETLVALDESAGAFSSESFKITAFSEETNVGYNRMLLTSYFEHRSVEALTMKPERWFQEKGIALVKRRVVSVNRQRKVVVDSAGEETSYDTLILATGSSAFVPPIQNVKAKGVFLYRTIEDLDGMIAYAKSCKQAAVMGGGLLGLEAAAALMHLNLRTTVIERNPYALGRQLDAEGASVMMQELDRLGLKVAVSKDTESILMDDNGAVRGVKFRHQPGTHSGDDVLECQMIAVSVGIIPRDELSKQCGLEASIWSGSTHARGGTVVDNELRTSDPAIFAVGEAVSHRGIVYGLVQPGYEMVQVVASVMAKERHLRCNSGSAINSPETKRFEGSDMSTKLKLAGVHVASFGDYFADRNGFKGVPASDVVTAVAKDPFGCSYKKLLFSKDGTRLYGGILVGDATTEYTKLHTMARSSAPLKVSPSEILGRKPKADDEGDDDLPDEAQVCSCNNVTKKDIVDCVKSGKASLGDIRSCTQAGTGCGGCVPAVTSIMNAEIKKMGGVVKNSLCEHFDFSRRELFEIVKITKIRNFRDLLKSHGKGDGCEVCKPAIASILASLHNEHIISKPHMSLQDTNDRFLANIQRGGSFSVVPRIAGGEITPEGLIHIGEVAKAFGLYTKITGGQRIDMFGAKKEDLPAIWEKLIAAGFESGHAYGKSLRTVKSCVGSAWCRYGMRDSTRFAIEVENRYKGVRSPHKLKGGVSGCVRECAEAQSKDFGLIATEKGWNVYVGGNGGSNPKHALLLAAEVSEELVIRYLDRFLMYYIATADKLTRTARWIEKLEGGLKHLQDVVIHDKLGIAQELEDQMAHLVSTYKDEWAEVVNNPDLREQFRQFTNTSETQENIKMVQKRGQPEPAPWPKSGSGNGPTKEATSAIIQESGDQFEWVDMGKTNDYVDDTGRTVKYGDTQIAIFRKVSFDGSVQWYATQNMCPHKRALVLSQGLIGDSNGVPKVACPFHKKTFALTTGKGIDDPNFSITTFETRIVDGTRIELKVPSIKTLDQALGTSVWKPPAIWVFPGHNHEEVIRRVSHIYSSYSSYPPPPDSESSEILLYPPLLPSSMPGLDIDSV
ncbi:nitrite reductase [Gonapodya prolifera JEL478]|uniref:Nitrite reductase n=1 Tax=Gonapodya prolifera (strain JEL478) TaxID=1344416 RepID=A0A139A2K0_GONPJ|nr:nitrite reductase [Gonapodya prolifera JEL478]|eukprot:KXS10868.1 nitrite reductase [Gonapodya prolifera JEL478]